MLSEALLFEEALKGPQYFSRVSNLTELFLGEGTHFLKSPWLCSFFLEATKAENCHQQSKLDVRLANIASIVLMSLLPQKIVRQNPLSKTGSLLFPATVSTKLRI